MSVVTTFEAFADTEVALRLDPAGLKLELDPLFGVESDADIAAMVWLFIFAHASPLLNGGGS